jgi:hypothetical protein
MKSQLFVFGLSFNLLSLTLSAWQGGPTPTPSPLPVNPTVENHHFLGLAGQTEHLMQKLFASPNPPASTVGIYDNEIENQSYNEQKKRYMQLSPQFKVVQYSLEKLDLLLHREIDRFLVVSRVGFDEILDKELPEKFRREDKAQEFFIIGYDDLKQGKHHGYVGYNNESFYQMYGVTHNFDSARILGGIAASESYMKLYPTHSKASYNTVWLTLGASKSTEHWIFSGNALFGYGFIKTRRFVDCIKETARSNHGIWSLSGEFKVAYLHDVGKVKLMPYDNLSYLYGQENNYHERGTSGDNFMVNGENLSAIRNELGLHLKGPRHRALHTFADGAWVFDYYLNDNAYRAAFEGSSIYGSFSQAVPSKNYGRVRAGFQGEHKKVLWQLAYTGLYGIKFAESSLSVDVGYEF